MPRYYSSTAAATTLAGPINSSVTSMNVGVTTGWPTSYPFTLVIGRGTPSEELVEVTAVSGPTITINRGVDGTVAVDHQIGAAVEHVVSARDFADFQTHMAASSGVHGASGALVPTLQRQTFTASGTFTPPAGISLVEVFAVGGGGAGGGSGGSGNNGMGGGGGQIVRRTLAVTPGVPVTVTIGNGGVGVSNGNGGSGQNTVVGSITAYGGGGGWMTTVTTYGGGAYGGNRQSGTGQIWGSGAAPTGSSPAGFGAYGIVSDTSYGGPEPVAGFSAGGGKGGSGTTTNQAGGASGGNGGTAAGAAGGAGTANTGGGGGGAGAGAIGTGGAGGSGYAEITWTG